MAYPIIYYHASTGSDTAPSDLVASGGSASGTGGATSIALGTTADLSSCAQDGSDYIWIAAASGNRHLFQIVSVTGTWAAATAVTIDKTISATFSGSDWYVNGTRKTLAADTSQSDLCDMNVGWTFRFYEGTYANGSCHFRAAEDASTAALGDPAITLEAASGATSRPIINGTSGFSFLDFWGGHNFIVRDVKFLVSGSGSNRVLVRNNVAAFFQDCVFDAGGLATQCVEVEASSTVVFEGCYFTGGTQRGIFTAHHSVKASVLNCTFAGAASRFTVAAISVNTAQITQQVSLVVIGCLIYRAAGDGIQWDTDGGLQATIVGNTVANCGGDGISINADEDLNHNAVILNNIVAYNGAYGLTSPSTGCAHHLVDYNATYSNTSGHYNGGWSQGPNGVTLTAAPFTDESTDDYTLNNTAGGGADCRGAAAPASMPDGT
jgi:hypothetical protein